MIILTIWNIILFYIFSPESVKKRDDIFYLEPKTNCVGDDAIWFRDSNLNCYQMEKMMQRLSMVGEIQVQNLGDFNQASTVDASGKYEMVKNS